MFCASHLTFLLLVCLLFAGSASAFGAGEVPVSSEFKGYVWRHGDIVEVLKFLPISFTTHHQFTQLQRRQIYFGNWLRDFSQIIDTTCLLNVPEPILRAIIAVLGFMEFGFATDEFDVTRERLGCYTHVEHVDNPRGYPDDAQNVDERLRGPVDPRELEIDPRTGMKNYIANSGQGWATSADYIAEQLEKCIVLGRIGRHKQGHSDSIKEAFVHLGNALHTLEDFAAHSNFTELCLQELGEESVFPFVGDACRIAVPHRKGRKVPPVVTGTFGMLDIFHSLLGEADDMAILQSRGSLGELESRLNYGGMAFEQLFELVKGAIEALGKFATDEIPILQNLEAVGLIFKKAKEGLPFSSSDDARGITNPNFLWEAIEPVFYFHDRLSKWIQESAQETEEQPNDSKNQLGQYTNQLVFRFLSLMIESALKELRNALKAAKEKVDEEAAKSTSAYVYEEGSSASDPSHSDLAKDHFSNVLNQPAGLVATVTTNWTTQQIIKCWDNPKLSIEETIDSVLTILHHPAFPKKRASIQQYMFNAVKQWWNDTAEDEKVILRSKLARQSVQARGHENHELTVKDLVCKRKGAAEFPGSRPRVKPPPKKASFPIAWAINDAMQDAIWIFTAIGEVLSDPRQVAAAVILALFVSWVVIMMKGLGYKFWPLGR